MEIVRLSAGLKERRIHGGGLPFITVLDTSLGEASAGAEVGAQGVGHLVRV
jgi:hypothetical protein